jgi:uncharacterized protein (TIGR02449 family)
MEYIMMENDLCFKLHKIEAHITQMISEQERMNQENIFLRKKLQDSIRQKRIMSEKVETASKKIKTLIRQLKEEAK